MAVTNTTGIMIHPQIDLYTRKVDEFMQKYPTITQYGKLKELEEKTGYPKSWFFVVGTSLLCSVIFLVGGAKLMVDLLGFVYPAYMSFKSMDSGTAKDTAQWLTYWVVLAFFSIFESLFTFLIAFIPMYYWFKIAAIVWMWHPTTKGAQTIYEQALRPIVGPYLGIAVTTEQKKE